MSERNQRLGTQSPGADPNRNGWEAYRQEMDQVRGGHHQGTQEVAGGLAQKLGAAVPYAGCLTASLEEVVRHGDALVDAVQAAADEVPEGLRRPGRDAGSPGGPVHRGEHPGGTGPGGGRRDRDLGDGENPRCQGVVWGGMFNAPVGEAG